MDAEIKREFDRLNAKLTALLSLEKEKKETWLKARDIMEVTGWDKEGMRRARVNGFVKQRKKNGIFYLLESIPEKFRKTA
jgi:flagellar motility protein MotE (MotC chaperone)